MPRYRINKITDSNITLHDIVETDNIKEFVRSVNENNAIDFTITDYELAFGTAKAIVDNPTGGYVGDFDGI